MNRRTSSRAGSVEIDRAAPRRSVAVGEIVLAECGQVGAFRPEVVVDDVEDHGEAVPVRGVDEAPEIVRGAVGARRGVERDAVVAPVPAAGEVGDRHQLDRGDPEVAQVRQTSRTPANVPSA